MDQVFFYLLLAAAVGSGLIAGTFFVFSVAVMPAFRQLPDATAMAAMKRINEVILNPIFLGVFLGTALLSVALAILAFTGEAASRTALLAGSLLYLLGTFAITVAFNIPLNNALAAGDDPAIWRNYLSRWTVWNHVRTIAAALASAAFTLAMAGFAER